MESLHISTQNVYNTTSTRKFGIYPKINISLKYIDQINMLSMSAASLLALLFIQGVAMGSKLPIMEAMRPEPLPEDNSLEPNADLNLIAPRREWVKFTSVPPKMVRRAPGAPLELECEAIGSPAPVIRWLRDNMPITEEDDYENNEISEASSNEMAKVVSRLVIDNILPTDKNSYTCIAQAGIKTVYATTNVYGTKGSSIKAQNLSEYIMMSNEVMAAPSKPRIVLFYTVLMDTIGSTIVIPCKSVGNPRAEVYWLDNEDMMIPKQDPRRKIMRTGELLIQGLRWSDMGGYTCVAKNPYAKDTISTFVYPMMKEN